MLDKKKVEFGEGYEKVEVGEIVTEDCDFLASGIEWKSVGKNTAMKFLIGSPLPKGKVPTRRPIKKDAPVEVKPDRYHYLEVGEIITADVEFSHTGYEGDWTPIDSEHSRKRIGKPRTHREAAMRRPAKVEWVEVGDGDLITEDTEMNRAGHDSKPEDADFVLVRDHAPSRVNGLRYSYEYKMRRPSISGKPAVRKGDFEKDYVEKLEGVQAVLWTCWNDEHKAEIKKQWEEGKL